MESRRCRADVVVVTKCAHPDEGAPQRVTRRDIATDLAESLEALRTDYVDLLLLHRDDPTVAVGEILEILNEHRESGRIRAFGASNWTTARLDEAREHAELRGLEGFACSSAQLSLAVQAEPMWPGTLTAGDRASRRWHERLGLPLLAWSAQAGGYFVRPDADADPDLVRVYGTPENRERRRRAEELGRARGADANAVALAWALHQPFPVWPVVGPQTPAELRATLAALELELSAEEVRWLALEDEAA